MSISIHGYVCKNNVDEKIVLVLLHWSFNTTDMFGSHTWRVEGGGGTISTGGSHKYLGEFVGHTGYLLLFRVC